MDQVLLLRGINVGGRNKLPMADLRSILAALGAEGPRTYIQSGNAVFGQPAGVDLTETAITAAIARHGGSAPRALLLTAAAFHHALAGNPFPTQDPKALHLFFLAAPSQTSDARLAAAAGPTERFHLTERVLYLHTPAHLSGSRLAPKLEALLGVPATGRNWRTCLGLEALLPARRP